MLSRFLEACHRLRLSVTAMGPPLPWLDELLAPLDQWQPDPPVIERLIR